MNSHFYQLLLLSQLMKTFQLIKMIEISSGVQLREVLSIESLVLKELNRLKLKISKFLN